MDIIQTPAEMQERAFACRRQGRIIGLVPTMGFLHEGHLSLIRRARKQCDELVVSIFVNPTQFGPSEDLDNYPQDAERDEALCRNEGVDVVFSPSPDNMYFPDASVWVDEAVLSVGLCGDSRPGHFRGVCTVVAKLFNLVLPDIAVFGEKDAQQLRIVERMVRDLNVPVKIIRGPIVREPDGLAMSSRNKYLSEQQREEALCLCRALDRAKELTLQGERRVNVLREAVGLVIKKSPAAQIDYIEFVNDESLEAVDMLAGNVLVALAVKIGSTRLIDNRVIRV